MTKERLYLFDTTLRDGAQTPGVDFSVEDKRTISLALDKLGIDYVEGGWPGANPTDSAFFQDAPKLTGATFTAFGMTKRPGRSADNDPGLAAVLNAETPAVCLVGKTWDFHIDVAFGVSLDEGRELVGDSIRHLVAKGREALFDAEHFFDGYKANKEFALDCLKSAMDNGARWVVLCDTNGGTLPHEIAEIVADVSNVLPKENIGIHCHNDTENAVANSLMAVRGGARMIQGALNGLGERCGNANITSLVPTLVLKPDFADHFQTNVTPEKLKTIRHTSHLLDELLNEAPARQAPYVGSSAFASAAGLHVSALQKDPKTYEHVEPESVGNQRQILVSNQSGKSNILARIREIGIEVDAKDRRVDRLLDEVKQREFEGYSYEGAEASFELMARRALGQVPEFFNVLSFRVMVERRHNARGDLVTISEATVKLNIEGREVMSVAEGNGPVNALDNALRKDIGPYADAIADMELVDFKVRILNGGTEAITRVMVESRDGAGKRWFTVGVSPNIVDASFQALNDAIVYKLLAGGTVAAAAE